MEESASRIRMGLPKGRMQDGVLDLLRQAGIPVRIDARGYRPAVGWDRAEAKMLKPQNIVEMLGAGSRDVGFAGADWVAELDVPLEDLLDTGLDPVRLVAAAPATLLARGELPRDRELVVASEYERLARRWIATRGLRARFVRSYGATEAFPPEDADCIVDNTATGSTLQANGLVVLDELMRSSTHLYASPRSLEDPGRRRAIEDLVLLLKSVLEARRRVVLELNVAADRLEAVVGLLPAMREPTVSPLHGGGGYAVKVAVRREELPGLIPRVKAAGGTDLLVTAPSQIVA
ncbi:ATP phosphoribosyltransferase [Myxococcota bacterium]|nr:ATP phosphoribosyltransferase [Myxococcota bacterium]